MSDAFNMSMWKFLKQVGVTLQKAIEDALREAGDMTGKTFEGKTILMLDGVDMEHVVTGTIKGND